MKLEAASWVRIGAAAFAIIAAVAAATWRRFRADGPDKGDWLRELLAGGLVAATGLLVVRPYLTASLIGAGDAYHYALQAADFIGQARRGIFPVLVGQTAFGFNGNVHTLRTAPYFTHVCGLMDWATGHRLPVPAVVNLVIAGTAVASAVSAYLSVRALAPRARLGSALLACLYVTSPGVAGPILGRDMVAAFMAMPWLPPLFLGLAQTLLREDPAGPLALATGALSMAWWSHPPTAAFASAAFAVAVLWRICLTAGMRSTWIGLGIAAVGGAAMVAYPFFSVLSMHLGSLARSAGTTASTVEGFGSLWPALVLPLSKGAGAPTDLQPGISMLLLGAAASFSTRLRRWPTVAFLAFAVLAALAFAPFSRLALLFWRPLPEAWVASLNPLPHQRIVPVLGAMIVVWAGCGFLDRMDVHRRSYRLFCALLGILALLSAAELAKFDWLYTLSARPADPELRPENVVLTRSSYLLFGASPSYFSNGYMEPWAEVRWLDRGVSRAWDNLDAVVAAAPVPAALQEVGRSLRIKLVQGSGYVLDFVFSDTGARGALTLSSGRVRRTWSLPLDGSSKSFGSLPGARHRLLVTPASHGDLMDISSSVPGVGVRVYPYRESELPLRLDSLAPLRLRVSAKAPGYLESPRVYIPGYRAAVNGRPAPCLVSPERLVMVPVPAGTSLVDLDYAGPPGLVAVYWLSLSTLGLWPLAIAGLCSRNSGRLTIDAVRRANLTRARRAPVLVALAVLAAAGAALWIRIHQERILAPLLAGQVRIKIQFDSHRGGTSEPLICGGVSGAADVLAVRYEPGCRLRFQYDHWGVGGPESASLPYDPNRVSTLAVTLPPRQAAGKPAGNLRIEFDGRLVLDAPALRYDFPPSAVVLGSNPVGSTICGPSFLGRIYSLRPEGAAP